MEAFKVDVKKTIKQQIGERNVIYFKGALKLIRHLNWASEKKMEFDDAYVKNIKIFGEDGYNTFCGYYDNFPLSMDEKRLLCQRVKICADARRDLTEIGLYSIENNQFESLAMSKAWNWQQGSRLKWSNLNGSLFYYNDVEGESYCTRIYDTDSKKKVRTIFPALYDISPDEKIGATLNFSRLQRLRPGYGYSIIVDSTSGDNAPVNDGLFSVDLTSGAVVLLVSLKTLALEVDPSLEHQHYINHISFSPDGRKIMFFHLWTENNWPGWMNRLCVYDIEKATYCVLEREKMVSHYDWMQNDCLLITEADKKTKKVQYVIYQIGCNSKTILNQNELVEDGHPTISLSKNFFVSDTYPNKKFKQYILLYDFDIGKRINIMRLFGDPRLDREYRCDLHPKFKNGRVLVDSTFYRCSRRIVMFDLQYKSREKK